MDYSSVSSMMKLITTQCYLFTNGAVQLIATQKPTDGQPISSRWAANIQPIVSHWTAHRHPIASHDYVPLIILVLYVVNTKAQEVLWSVESV